MGDPPRPAAHCREVSLLAGRDASVGAMAGYLAVQRALSAIDRLEVRGRDSAGLHLFVWNHGLDESDPTRRRSAGRAGRRSVVPIRVRPLDRRLPVVRLQGGRRDRRARRQHPGAPRRGRRATPCCGARWPRPMPKSRSSGTRGGRASASSPSPTPIRSTARRSSDAAARTPVRTSSPRSTATSTTTPTSASSTGCGSMGRSPPTPR